MVEHAGRSLVNDMALDTKNERLIQNWCILKQLLIHITKSLLKKRNADDGQLNVHLRIQDVTVALQNMETYVGDVQNWCASKRLQFNPSKTEVIWFGTSNSLKKLSGTDLCLHIEIDTMSPTKFFVILVFFAITN